MKNQIGGKIIQPNNSSDDEHGKYAQLCSEIHHKFRSNIDLPSGLNENSHHIITFQFISLIFN